MTLFQDFLHDIVTEETSSVSIAAKGIRLTDFTSSKVAYTDCSTTHGVLSLDPYVLRFDNGTAGEIYGNGGESTYI